MPIKNFLEIINFYLLKIEKILNLNQNLPLERYSLHQWIIYFLLGLFFFTIIFTISSSKVNKNALKLLFIIELLTLLISLIFLVVTNYYQILDGQIFVLFLLTISALEASIGLAFIYLYFRYWRTTTLNKFNKK